MVSKWCVFGVSVLLLSSCVAIIRIPVQEPLAKEKSEIEADLNRWINKSVEELLDFQPNVFQTLDLGGGNIRYTFRTRYLDYVTSRGYRYYDLYFFISGDGTIYKTAYEMKFRNNP